MSTGHDASSVTIGSAVRTRRSTRDVGHLSRLRTLGCPRTRRLPHLDVAGITCYLSFVLTRLLNLRDRSGEFCVYKWVASHLSRPKKCNICKNLSQPVTAVGLCKKVPYA